MNATEGIFVAATFRSPCAAEQRQGCGRASCARHGELKVAATITLPSPSLQCQAVTRRRYDIRFDTLRHRNLQAQIIAAALPRHGDVAADGRDNAACPVEVDRLRRDAYARTARLEREHAQYLGGQLVDRRG